MNTEQKNLFFQCLFSVAWTDGTVGEEERELLTGMVEHLTMDEEERERLARWFESPPDEPDWRTAVSGELADQLVRQVFLVAASDGVVNTDEISMLERLRMRMEMTQEHFQSLLVEAEKLLAGQT